VYKGGGGGTDPENLAIELNLGYHMSDPTSKFEEDWIKIVVAVMNEMFVRIDKDNRQTNTVS